MINRLSAEDVAYLSGVFEHGGLAISSNSAKLRIALTFVGTTEEIQNLEHIIGEPASKFKPQRTARITSCDTQAARMLGGNPYCQWNHIALRQLLPQLRFRTPRMEQRRAEAIELLNQRRKNESVCTMRRSTEEHPLVC
jgi:hypothetical protein